MFVLTDTFFSVINILSNNIVPRHDFTQLKAGVAMNFVVLQKELTIDTWQIEFKRYAHSKQSEGEMTITMIQTMSQNEEA